jgi:deoxyribodipyrimidine photo-lyase
MYPFQGGETHAQNRLNHFLSSGSITTYHNTYDKLLGADGSSKLSPYLTFGCITARQIHASLVAYEDGDPETEEMKGSPGFGGGENKRTIRFRVELLWRDYAHQCARKFGDKLFSLRGFKQVEGVEDKWACLDKPLKGQNKEQVIKILGRFLNGTTGMGLIDASQRELHFTGYKSSRARSNTAFFLIQHLSLDWRLGAEWYEYALVDHDSYINWSNWQYIAGVGNDPRNGMRTLNPVKQAHDYDPSGEYIKTWVPELDSLRKAGHIFQAWTCQDEILKKEIGLKGLDWVEMPLAKIIFEMGIQRS